MVAVADVNDVEARKVGEEHKARWYSDYGEMLEKEDLDVASVCVPHFLHERVATDVAKHGVNVVLEKPIAMRISEADRIIGEAKRRGVKLGVVFQMRFRPSVIGARKLIDGGLRPLFRCALTCNLFRGSAYYSSAEWRGTWAGEGGGVLVNQGIHYLDLLQSLVSAPPKVTFATASTVAHRIQVEDLASGIIEFRDGVQSAVQLSTIDVPQIVRLEFRGDGGIVSLDDERCQIAANRPSLRKQMDSTRGLFESPRYKWKLIASDVRGQNLHTLFYKDFLNAVRRDGKPAIDGAEGRKALELANAMIYSAVTGEPVRHPLDPDKYDRLYHKLVREKKLHVRSSGKA